MDPPVAGIDRGVHAGKFAAPEPSPMTGAFACEVRNATLIHGGELRNLVRYALLTGNSCDGLRAVKGLGRDPMPVPAFHGSPGCAYVPAVAFARFELVGRA